MGRERSLGGRRHVHTHAPTQGGDRAEREIAWRATSRAHTRPPTQPKNRTRPEYARMRVQTITPSSRIAPGGVAARRVVQTRALNFGKKKAAPPAKKSGTKFAFPGTQKAKAPAKKRAPPPKKQKKQAASSGGGSIFDQFSGGISEQFAAGDQRYY